MGVILPQPGLTGGILKPSVLPSNYFGLVSKSLTPWALITVVCFILIGSGKIGTLPSDNEPTTLGPLELLASGDDNPNVPPKFVPEKPLRQLLINGDVFGIDDRYVFTRNLGHGMQGYTSLYIDKVTNRTVVVKRLLAVSEVLMPEAYVHVFEKQTRVWPMEIPSTLWLAGFEPQHGTNDDISRYPVFRNDLIPVLDYFLLSTPNSPKDPSLHYTWNFVTPYISGGTLVDLASNLKKEASHTPEDLYVTLLPAFLRFLSSIAILNSRGYCHDDIKPDNIFALTRKRWLLGDIGRVHQIYHPYHLSRAWRRGNQWSNCQLNDVRRALKTFMTLLRDASSSSEVFDREFYAEREPWSKLYWDFMRRPLYAAELLSLQQTGTTQFVLSGSDGRAQAPDWLPLASPDVLALAVKRELTCTILKTTWAEWWALGGLWQRFPLEKSLVSRKRQCTVGRSV